MVWILSSTTQRNYGLYFLIWGWGRCPRLIVDQPPPGYFVKENALEKSAQVVQDGIEKLEGVCDCGCQVFTGVYLDVFPQGHGLALEQICSGVVLFKRAGDAFEFWFAQCHASTGGGIYAGLKRIAFAFGHPFAPVCLLGFAKIHDAGTCTHVFACNSEEVDGLCAVALGGPHHVQML